MPCNSLHKFDLFDYYKREKEDLMLRTQQLQLKQKINIVCKIKKLLGYKISPLKKIYYLFELFIYYLLKVIILIQK